MPVSLILDIIISVLLVLTIAYAVRLNQRLLQLRSDKNELLVLAKTFAEATVRAEKAIVNLKISSETLTTEIVKAETLKDDLAYLVNRGGRSADEMVESVRSGVSQPAARSGGSDVHDETRLIEDAIRAATPGANTGIEETGASRGGANTRRISGQYGSSLERPQTPLSRPERAETTPFSLQTPSSSRAAKGGDAIGEASGEAIGDTPAARELLKALGSVE